MKAFAHLSFLNLLIVISAISQNTATASTIVPTTTASTTTPTTTASTTTPTATASTTTPTATASTTTPTATAITTTPTATASTTTPTATASTTTPTATASSTTPTATASTTTPTATASTTSTTTASTIAPTTTANTTAPANTTITAAPAATTTTTIAPTSSSVISPGLCKEDSCSSGASCVGLKNSYFCLCIDGYYYNSSTCNKGKVFPGTIKVNISETSGLEDEKSQAYQNLYVEITKFFADAFKNTDYGQTVIHRVRTSAPARSEMRAGDKLVDVTVVNLFAETSEENETTISNKINKAVASNPNTFSDYTKQNRCEFYGCVNEQDNCRDILQCKCKPGLSRPNPQTALCLALGPKCPDNCNAENNMQCLVPSSGNPDCVCLPGYQKDAKGHCQACAFGYSGVNCEDSFQLILTIVGTIAGILILGMVIALISLRSKTKGIEEQNLIDNDYHSLRMSTTGFSNLGAEGSLFPKVQATFPKDSPLQNPYTQRSMPRPDY